MILVCIAPTACASPGESCEVAPSRDLAVSARRAAEPDARARPGAVSQATTSVVVDCELVADLALREGRYHHTVSRLPSGEILVVGGKAHDAGPMSRSVERIDLAARRVHPAASLAVGRASHGAIVQGGRVVVAGGATERAHVDARQPMPRPEPPIEIYDPSSDRWRSVGAYGYYGNAANPLLAPLPDGRVAIVGGDGLMFQRMLDEVWLVDPLAPSVEAGPSLPQRRAGGDLYADPDGTLQLAHGYGKDAAGLPLRSLVALELAPGAAAWVEVPSAPPPTPADEPPRVAGARELFIRGDGLRTRDNRPVARFAHRRQGAAAARLDPGHVVVVGGGEASTSVEICAVPSEGLDEHPD